MVEYFRNRNEATCSFIETDKRKIFNVMTCAADFLDLNQDETMSLINQKEFIEYALEHGEKNMIDLFKHFHFPVPETEEEKEDPRFCLYLLYKKGPEGNFIPRENIYYCERHIKGYKNPFKSSLSILDDGSKIENKSLKQLDEEENFDKMKKKKILDKSIDMLSNIVSRDAISNNKINENENSVKLLKYSLCIKYYAEQFKFKEISKITLDEICSIGQIYYIIKRASKENDKFNNPFNNCRYSDDKINEEVYNFSVVEKRTKKEETKKSFIDKLIKNFRIADNNFGYFSVKPEESQILFNNCVNWKIIKEKKNNKNKETDSQVLLNKFSKIILASQKSNNFENNINSNVENDLIINNNVSKMNNESRYGDLGNSALYDDNRLLLILKGKRIDFTDRRGKRNKNQFYFKFYLEKKLLNTVEVIFNENVAKENVTKFKKIMSQVKFNEEVIIVFVYNPTIYFNVKYKNYERPPSGVESVYYIDSDKENLKVIEIFNEVNK